MFEEFIGIDWSGAKQPVKTHSISLASCQSADASAPIALESSLSRQDVYEQILARCQSSHKTLIGIDCNFSYCYKVGKEQFSHDARYTDLWKEVENLNIEQTNFFAGECWKQESFKKYFWTEGKQPDWFNIESLQRATEARAHAQEFGKPESPFKLIGAKQVGKGGLAGMRLLRALKEKCGDALAIWPFEMDKVQKAKVVIAEIYPRLFIRKAGLGNAKVRDVPSLNKVLHHYSSKPFDNDMHLNDHLTDAIIASAGLRSAFAGVDQNIEFEKQIKHTPLNTEGLPKRALIFEGWILGVEAL